jgi:hypothetical protein
MPIAMPKAKLQHYNWHINKNIIKRLAEKRYLGCEKVREESGFNHSYPDPLK